MGRHHPKRIQISMVDYNSTIKSGTFPPVDRISENHLADDTLFAGIYLGLDPEAVEKVKKQIKEYIKRVPRKNRLTQAELYDALGLNDRPIKFNKAYYSRGGIR